MSLHGLLAFCSKEVLFSGATKLWMQEPWIAARLESLFSARGRYFSPSNLRTWKNHPALPPPYEMTYFSNSARLIGRCAHGNLFARGRSSARTTYFPVWDCRTHLPCKISNLMAFAAYSLPTFSMDVLRIAFALKAPPLFKHFLRPSHRLLRYIFTLGDLLLKII